LWEALTKAEKIPQPNETCLEIGASPGSWTWALQQLNATVYASDRAPLDPKIAALPKVHFLQKDAFSLKPSDFPKLDWIFSDVICYPEKLLRWLEQWLPSKIRFVCTLKFQGTDGYGIVEEFKKIPGSQVSHLYHNKHELVWIKTVDSF
jgi:23S rRNA (cytidine2498-2'-O)-methyltransferase